MAKITAFGKSNLSAVRAKINAAMEQVEKEFGIKIDIGTISYDSAGTSFKTTLSAVIATGAVADPVFSDVPAQYVNDLIKWKGKDSVGKKVTILGESAIVVGIKNKAYIFKYVAGSPAAKRHPGLRRINFINGDMLDCQVTGRNFKPNLV